MSLLMGGAVTEVDGLVLDSRLRFILRLSAMAGTPDFGELPVSEMRAYLEALGGALGGKRRWMEKVEERRLPSPGGEIPVRIYSPRGSGAPLPVLVYYHGGGWVLGSLDTVDLPCRRFAREADCIVVSVDYRLAPEHVFPAAVDDALAAFTWTVANAVALGGDPMRVAVGGDSAGGNLAAVVSILARDAGGPRPAAQMLVYPVTDLSCESRSYQLFADGFQLTRQGMRWFKDCYLDDPASACDPRVSPLLAPDLSDLPPALVLAAGFDPLRDEGRAYARRLEEAGVTVDYRCFDSLVHGFINMDGVIEAADEAMVAASAALAAGFGSLEGASP